ncbi:MAG TPA: histidine kinase [Solirubrobacterales bacterium]|jgi:signal transduction histidine kinase
MRLGALTPLQRALIAIALLGVLLGIALFVIATTSAVPAAPLLEAFITVLVGWSFIGTGLFAWDRRPTNLIGQLMVCVGFFVFIAELTVSDIPLAAALGFAFNSLPVAFLIHLLIVFPSGRARSRADRFFIGYAYLAGGLIAGLPVFFYNPATDPDCAHCVTSNPLLIHDSLDFVNTWLNTLSAVSIPVLFALFVHLVRRARSEDPGERRSQEPVWWAGGATVFLFAATLLTNLGPESGNYDDVVWYIANIVFATVPFAFLLGLLRTRLSEADLVAEENVRLDAELQARLDELRESRARIVEAGYVARRKLERDLHDGAQQRLVGLALDLRLARERIEDDPRTAAAMLDEASAELSLATEELRELARGIHPAILSDRGLEAAVESLARRAPLPVEINASIEGRLPEPVEAAAYFVVAEALTNVVRHAGANRAGVGIRRDDGRLVVEVTDDGGGGADPAGSGLRGLADRVAALDGRLRVEPSGGHGTIVRADIPLRQGNGAGA